MTTHTGTFAPTADGRGTIALDDAPDLPAGRRVRVVVEPAAAPAPPDDAAPPAAPPDRRPGIEQVAGRWAEHADELEAHVEEMRRLRRLTREDARRLRGEE